MRVSAVSAISFLGLALLIEGAPLSVHHQNDGKYTAITPLDSHVAPKMWLGELERRPARVARAEQDNFDVQIESFDQSEADLEVENTLGKRKVVSAAEEARMKKLDDQNRPIREHFMSLWQQLQKLTPGTPEYAAKQKGISLPLNITSALNSKRVNHALKNRDADAPESENTLSKRMMVTPGHEAALKKILDDLNRPFHEQSSSPWQQLQKLTPGTPEYAAKLKQMFPSLNVTSPIDLKHNNRRLNNKDAEPKLENILSEQASSAEEEATNNPTREKI